MNELKVPYQRMMFVCTRQRDGEAACNNVDRGDSAGDHLVGLLREEVKKRGLKGKIRVAQSGCMDLCQKGPNIMVFNDKGDYTLFSGVTQNDIPALVDRYIQSLEKPTA